MKYIVSGLYRKFKIIFDKRLSNANIDTNLVATETAPNNNVECKHDWSSRYDYSYGKGTVKIVESKCLKCGLPEQGSGQ